MTSLNALEEELLGQIQIGERWRATAYEYPAPRVHKTGVSDDAGGKAGATRKPRRANSKATAGASQVGMGEGAAQAK